MAIPLRFFTFNYLSVMLSIQIIQCLSFYRCQCGIKNGTATLY